jgi:transposase
MSTMEKAARSRRSFTSEFKADAVALVIDEGRSIADVARSLGIGEQTLGNWVRQARIDRGERAGLTTNERVELAELRREVARLRMERELLKRATAVWVRISRNFAATALRVGPVIFFRRRTSFGPTPTSTEAIHRSTVTPVPRRV